MVLSQIKQSTCHEYKEHEWNQSSSKYRQSTHAGLGSSKTEITSSITARNFKRETSRSPKLSTPEKQPEDI